MPDDPAFIRMIAAAPDDDAPRLVYADYLEETGDPAKMARAEFIRVQVEKARLVPDTSRWSELWHRDTTLLDWAREWRRELPVIEQVEYGGFVRGFIDQILVSTAALRRHFPLLLNLLPIRIVTLGNVDVRSFRKIAQTSEFMQIEELRFAPGSRLSSALTKELAKRGPWPKLRRLGLNMPPGELLDMPPDELIALTHAFGDRLKF
jgi:uncharacterized protein (TIGR02996 family)